MHNSRTEYIFQDDGTAGMCSGFMIFSGREAAIELLSSMRARLPEVESDQKALNRVIAPSSAILLPHHLAWTYGLHGAGKWKPGIPPHSPAGIAAHHANWTRGVENKMLLLRAVLAEQMAPRTEHRQ